MTRGALAVAALLLSACARNAVIDLDVVIPVQTAPPDGRTHAWIEVGTSLNDFDDQVFSLDGTDVDVTAIAGGSQRVLFTVVAGDPNAELRLRVRYCREERCDGATDMVNLSTTEPGIRWTFERAFYSGERTSATVTVPALATGVEGDVPRSVCRCEVIGCVTGLRPGDSSCRDTTNRCDPTAPHFCD